MTHLHLGRIVLLALISMIWLLLVQAGVVAQEQQHELVMLNEGSPLRVVTAEEISSKTASPGDRVMFKVAEDLVVDGHVVIGKGTDAKGSVINAEPSGRMGKSGKLGIQVESTKTVDGQPIKLRAAKGKEGADKTNSTTVLAITVSSLFLLTKGGEATIAAGTPITVEVAEERRFRVVDGTLVAANPPVATDAAASEGEAAAPQYAIVYIYRPSKFVGRALEPSVFVDDTELARMDNGRYFALKLKPGKHLVHMTSEKKGFAIDMGAGNTYYFRVGIEAGMWKGQGKITLEDPERALPEIRKLKFIGKDKIKDQTLVVELPPAPPT
jgi:Protein of unknown function (DUF2846)